MVERVLFLTGHLARPRLEKVLHEAGDLGFSWSIVDIGVKVAALMTAAIIANRLDRPVAADRVFIVSPKSGADDIKDKGKATRADFSLK